MALLKEIELENGIKVNYHRITSVNEITNNNSIIEVSSYFCEKIIASLNYMVKDSI